jgi:hypothetical protein
MSPRTLNFADVAAAYQLPPETLDQLASPIIDRLRALPVIGSVDEAGIAYRGRLEYERAIGVEPAIAVAAARRKLHQLRASMLVIEALEFVPVISPRVPQGGPGHDEAT